MEFYEVLRRRRMVREFQHQPIQADRVDRIVRAGLRGPSAGYTQGYAQLVLQAPEARRRFWERFREYEAPDGIRRAPLVIVAFASKTAYLDRYAEPDKGWTDRDENRWPVPYWYIDTGFVVLLVLVAAVAEGLGAVFFAIAREDWPDLRDAFDVPTSYEPIGRSPSATPPTKPHPPRTSQAGRNPPRSWSTVARGEPRTFARSKGRQPASPFGCTSRAT